MNPRHRQIGSGILRDIARQDWSGYLFVLPILITFSLFVIYPLIRGLALSFMDYRPLGGSSWVGLKNYHAIFVDPLFWKTLKVTTVYTLAVVPGGVLIALFLAFLIFPLSKPIQTFFKASYYLPGVVSAVVLALVWGWIYAPTNGLLNYLLSLFGLGPVKWLSDPKTALFSVILMSLITGQGASIVFLLAAMGQIPSSIIESARLDGANGWQEFWHITLPLLRPSILYLLVMGTIGSYQIFDTIFVMTGGGPYYATTTIAYLIYTTGFDLFEFGLASAQSVILFLIILILALIQFRVLSTQIEY